MPNPNLKTITDKLYPSDPTRCAEPLDIDESRWLLNQLIEYIESSIETLDCLKRVNNFLKNDLGLKK